MTRDTRVTVRWTVLVGVALALIATGAAAMYLVLGRGRASSAGVEDPAMPAAASGGGSSVTAPSAAPDAPLPDVVVTLSQEAVERARITVAPVGTGASATALRLPGVVEPDAYRRVTVTPLTAGRMTRVLVELGQSVRRGQSLAQIFSPELAEAHTRYTSARAELAAHEQELQRTQKLVEIGAASRQELERIHAAHTAQTAEVQSARARLELLGVSPAVLDRPTTGAVAATITVPAPIAGVVTERAANVGLNVDPSTTLFTVVDLSTVWVVADLYEKDFSRVRVGSAATVTTTAYPDLSLQGRVNYIDPQVSPETRTARLRIEVRNPGNALRLGMFADVHVGSGGTATVPLIPRSAVQTVGDRQVVYLVNAKESGKFTEREVHLGPSAGQQIEVVSGVQPGDVVVTEGSFFVRAERERLGLRTPSAAAAPDDPSAAGANAKNTDVQTARVVVGDQAFEPSRLILRAGAPAQVTFVRTSDKTCATEVTFPSLNIKRALPLNQPVVIEFTPTKRELAFACGMNMLRGSIVAE